MAMTPLFDINVLCLQVSHCCILALPSRFLGSSRQRERVWQSRTAHIIIVSKQREQRTTSLWVSFFSTFLDIQAFSL